MPALLRPHEAGYPALLGAVPSAPDLYFEGEWTAEDDLAVAIVGSRRPSPYGVEVAGRLAADLAARRVTIVSGFARGIDTAAHRGALEAGGRTVAVMGNGLDVVYPPENRALAREVVARGALVSQFPPGTPPRSGHFPARNRTIAGLVLGVVVVEAADRSGALITAGYAADLGREVFAVPGKITSATSAGCHRLIQDGAKLVTTWADVVQELPEQWRRAVRDAAPPDADTSPAGSLEGRLFALLACDEPRDIDRLIEDSGETAPGVAAALVALELQGRVRQLGGQRWVAITKRVRRA